MAQLINASINLSQIDKTKIIEGKKGKYINVTISVNDEKDQYDNDTSIYIAQSKEEREAKQDRIYLGNGRVFWSSDSQPEAKASAPKPQAKPEAKVTEEEDLPF